MNTTTSAELDPPKKGLGTFLGVYLPSLLSCFGVIVYSRMGLILGSVGLVPTLFIVIFASSIALLTALSISTSATNMTIRSGGSYYLISRAFGKELGASIGVPLFLAQSVGAAFCLTGFVESVTGLFPSLSTPGVGIGALLVLTLLAYSSATLALKIQGVIFLAVTLSLVSFFLGDTSLNAEPTERLHLLQFWPAFALFFPTVTGIEAGVCMAGELRNPSKSLARGVVLAVSTGLLLYIAMVWHMHTHASRTHMNGDLFVVEHIAKWGWMIVMGLWCASLSNGMGGLLAAPRTLQALAQDGILPSFLGKRLSTVVTFLIAACCLYFGHLDGLAPYLAMFFLLSYGMLNLAAGLEGFMHNPSWRPTFRTPPTLSLVGAALCIVAMFMINSGASFISIAIVIGLYAIALRRSLSSSWDDIRQGILLLFARAAVYRLSEKAISSRAWRPNFLVFTNGYLAPHSLLSFTSQITQGKGLLVVASIFSKTTQSFDKAVTKKRIQTVFKRKHIQALSVVLESDHPLTSTVDLFDTCGLGVLRPNTIVLGDTSETENRKEIAQVIQRAHVAKLNSIVIVERNEENFTEFLSDQSETGRIDLWWDDELKENSQLMLVLANMLNSSRKHGEIHVKCTVQSETARAHRQAYLDTFFAGSRFKVQTHVYVCDNSEEEVKLKEHFSKEAALVLSGLRPPKEAEENYFTYYRTLVRAHRKVPRMAFVLAAESMNLEDQ